MIFFLLLRSLQAPALIQVIKVVSDARELEKLRELQKLLGVLLAKLILVLDCSGTGLMT